ncbi:putative glutamate decarboxylase [Phaeomoniella chlamydospora]|uniref:Putative glutamate decarboxylase n=1 Tax=Phaeomoniella chlamydospora TaxID=158046 RepID=A0A0G2DXP8_PHACM|nr:putative glutamate decarboxylase [Phaeomoniella chlamydospora]
MEVNGFKQAAEPPATWSCSRAEEVQNLLSGVQEQLVPFIKAADDEIHEHETGRKNRDPSPLLKAYSAQELREILKLKLPSNGTGRQGVLDTTNSILSHSVNTFAPGFLDKLYGSTNAPGLAAELLLAALNTNVHVYQVSPVLTLIEKYVGRELAKLFGLVGPSSGGISCQGGSASNLTSIVIARNNKYPSTKVYGNHHEGRQLVLFTSAHAHYSIEKAAQACGFGSAAVISVPVDPITGQMLPQALDHMIIEAKLSGKTPFYVNATAGSTVLGSFDPFPKISQICKKHNLWFHIDASWGGPFIFSPTLNNRLNGASLADSIAINPHKMMAVPVTCSFLLAADLQQFHAANTLPAGYLFHSNPSHPADEWQEPIDQADMTLQCGRRGDGLKLFLSWQYYGTIGYESMITNAHNVATYFAHLVNSHPDLLLVSDFPPPCLQVCFYYAPGKNLLHQLPTTEKENSNSSSSTQTAQQNSILTTSIAQSLIPLGFMTDYAPALEGREWMGKFFRVVVNISTRKETLDRLIEVLTGVGKDVVKELDARE